MKTILIPKFESMGAEKLPEEKLFEYIVTADISVLQKMLQKNPGCQYNGSLHYLKDSNSSLENETGKPTESQGICSFY